jgi:hypothetical protein
VNYVCIQPDAAGQMQNARIDHPLLIYYVSALAGCDYAPNIKGIGFAQSKEIVQRAWQGFQPPAPNSGTSFVRSLAEKVAHKALRLESLCFQRNCSLGERKLTDIIAKAVRCFAFQPVFKPSNPTITTVLHWHAEYYCNNGFEEHPMALVDRSPVLADHAALADKVMENKELICHKISNATVSATAKAFIAHLAMICRA